VHWKSFFFLRARGEQKGRKTMSINELSNYFMGAWKFLLLLEGEWRAQEG
jgi:hypothetical protein